MRWNERIRLVIATFNRSAVAVLGAAAIGSAFGATGGTAPAGTSRSVLDLLDGVSMTSVGCALALHLLAHVLVGLIEPEE